MFVRRSYWAALIATDLIAGRGGGEQHFSLLHCIGTQPWVTPGRRP
jgi:hypothetical protein